MAAKKKQRRKRKLTDTALAESIASFSKPAPKNTGGRPPKYAEGLSPELMIAIPHYFKNPDTWARDKGEFFWDVFSIAETPEGRDTLQKGFAQWEEAIEKNEESARKLREVAIQVAEMEFKKAEADAESSRKEIAQLRALVESVEFELPSAKAQKRLKLMAKFFAKEKARNRYWRKEFQKTMPKKYQKLRFYRAVSDWFYDKYQYRYAEKTISKAISEASL